MKARGFFLFSFLMFSSFSLILAADLERKNEQKKEPEKLAFSKLVMPFPPPIIPDFYNDLEESEEEVESICGNGVLDPGEGCDDGNLKDGDGCGSTCESIGVCGNGTVEADESCDDGNTQNSDGCSSACQANYVCGNGIVETGEGCDDGNASSGDGCNSKCQNENFCGNGIQDDGEQCDDGNSESKDGCSSSCQLEKLSDQSSDSAKSASARSCVFESDCSAGNSCVKGRCTEVCPAFDQCLSDSDCGTGSPQLQGNDCVCAAGSCDPSNSCPGLKACQAGRLQGGCWSNVSSIVKTGLTSVPGCQAECEMERRSCGPSTTLAVVGTRITGGTYQVGDISCSCLTGQVESGGNFDAAETNACASVSIQVTCN